LLRSMWKCGNIFWFSYFTRQCSKIPQARWKSLWFIENTSKHREFSYESIGERILKFGPDFPQTSTGIVFLRHKCVIETFVFFETQCR